MEAGSNGTACTEGLEYRRHGTHECIYGTKEQLQSLGLGIGVSFPGEQNGPARVLRVIDPRGLVCKITRDYTPGRFDAMIDYPWGPKAPVDPMELLPGNVKVTRHIWGDDYVGSPESLMALGLLQAHQFPGLPGMRKTRVTIYADGTVATCAPNTHDRKARELGARTVERVGPKSYRVWVRGLSDEEAKKREAASSEAMRRWHRDVMAIPQPAPLRPVYAERVQAIARARGEAASDAGFQRFLSRLSA